MALEISTHIISSLPLPNPALRLSPEYQQAILAGAAYWKTVITGKPDDTAKAAADEALSALLHCQVSITGKRRSLKDKILRAFS